MRLCTFGCCTRPCDAALAAHARRRSQQGQLFTCRPLLMSPRSRLDSCGRLLWQRLAICQAGSASLFQPCGQELFWCTACQFMGGCWSPPWRLCYAASLPICTHVCMYMLCCWQPASFTETKGLVGFCRSGSMDASEAMCFIVEQTCIHIV